MSGKRITVDFTRSEALVLFEWLASFDDAGKPRIPDEAEQIVLWRIEGQLEPELVEIVEPDYSSKVQAAKEEVTGHQH